MSTTLSHGSSWRQRFGEVLSLVTLVIDFNNFTTTRNVGTSELSKTVSYLLSLFYDLLSLNDVARERLLSSFSFSTWRQSTTQRDGANKGVYYTLLDSEQIRKVYSSPFVFLSIHA